MEERNRGLRPRVLLIEDDEAERGLLRELLDAEGIDVVGEAANGADGVEAARELLPEVVLTDLRMPVMGGIEATRAIKETQPLAQVIILTVYGGPLPTRSAEELGAYAYLVKGCSVAFIRDVIMQAWLYRRGLEECERELAREAPDRAM